jgi:hypothetical protein
MGYWKSKEIKAQRNGAGKKETEELMKNGKKQRKIGLMSKEAFRK